MTLDPTALLCENCGYHLAGLAPEANCPECGLAVAASLPEKRVGTPWQRKPSLRSLIGSVWMTLRHPIGVWSVVRIDRARTEEFAVAIVALGLVVPSAALAVWTRFALWPMVAVWGGAWAIQALAVYTAILIEVAGIRFFGGRHEFRITRDVSRTICAHAAPGWLIGAVLVTIIAIVFRLALPTDFLALRIAYLAAAFIGLLSFETLVYIGMRRMRFANRAGARLFPMPPLDAEPAPGAERTMPVER